MAMTRSAVSTAVRVEQRFDAAAERVYDAFLDPKQAGRFLFATPTGQVVRCDIDPRVGGTFTIVDRRGGEEVVHTGTYVKLERPRLIAFTLLVEQYSREPGTVSIEVVPLPHGCLLTLTAESKREEASQAQKEGWQAILQAAAELVVDDAPTCGIGIARHATIPAAIGVMFAGLADTLELHRRMLVMNDPNAQNEDAVYGELAASWREIAQRVEQAAARMSAQRELPMGAHDEAAWGQEHLRAFERFVKGQSQTLSLLKVAAERDETMLASMQKAPA
jgi:uncharacterized protein YndB with AHSA1/START domain